MAKKIIKARVSDVGSMKIVFARHDSHYTHERTIAVTFIRPSQNPHMDMGGLMETHPFLRRSHIDLRS